MKNAPITYSFVIPFMNEEAVLPLLFERMSTLMNALDGPSEVVLVDDGSRDRSAALVADQSGLDPRFKMIRLSRNFGHQIAVTAGLDAVQGQAIIIMDADLQDPPELVHEMVAKWREGYQIVHAQRRERAGETWFKRTSAKLFYQGLSKLASVEIPQNVGDFRLVGAEVVRAIQAMPERDRFLRGMFAWVGFRQTFVQFDRPERAAGETKYPLRKMMRLAMDGVVGFSDAPLRMALWLGALVSLGAIGYGAYITFLAVFSNGLVEGWASTVVILAFLSGVNLLISGVIGLYVGRIHNEAKQRPLYFVSEKVGLSEVTQLHPPQQVSYAQR
jgi:dolichol-phosphate mannosyltransferase